MSEIGRIKRKYLNKINKFETIMQNLSNEELQNKTQYFRELLENGSTLNQILPEAFAVVREASNRILKMRPYDVQMIGGVVLHEGKIAELYCGEGKTLTAVAPVYLNALSGESVHVVTVNDYLANRDMETLRPLYEFSSASYSVSNSIKPLASIPTSNSNKGT